ncbi:hypothetical protein DPX16_13384 [Anabarilius grahami]|uniref:Uncharacterized protein n=1 Tax=Anabarilius grahami TaxID=495550 RepID=A0A3N0YN95_ANAGA|nr:hypothetical protein DPX16_13384 [Anabarilius grahami]
MFLGLDFSSLFPVSCSSLDRRHRFTDTLHQSRLIGSLIAHRGPCVTTLLLWLLYRCLESWCCVPCLLVFHVPWIGFLVVVSCFLFLVGSFSGFHPRITRHRFTDTLHQSRLIGSLIAHRGPCVTTLLLWLLCLTCD